MRQGQAVWDPGRDAPEIAGEVIAAWHKDGRFFVQFSKVPFPVVEAQAEPGRWQLRLPAQNRRHAGSGSPPERVIWFQLARQGRGEPLAPGYSWSEPSPGAWKLAHEGGESVQGFWR